MRTNTPFSDSTAQNFTAYSESLKALLRKAKAAVAVMGSAIVMLRPPCEMMMYKQEDRERCRAEGRGVAWRGVEDQGNDLTVP